MKFDKKFKIKAENDNEKTILISPSFRDNDDACKLKNLFLTISLSIYISLLDITLFTNNIIPKKNTYL